MDVPTEAPHKVAGKAASKGLAGLKNLPPWAYVVGGGVFLVMLIWYRHSQTQTAALNAASAANVTDPTATGIGGGYPTGVYGLAGGTRTRYRTLPSPHGVRQSGGGSSGGDSLNPHGIKRFPPPGGAPPAGNPYGLSSVPPAGWYYTGAFSDVVLVPIDPTILEDANRIPTNNPPHDFQWFWAGSQGYGWVAPWTGQNTTPYNSVPQDSGAPQETTDPSDPGGADPAVGAAMSGAASPIATGGGAPNRPDVHHNPANPPHPPHPKPMPKPKGKPPVRRKGQLGGGHPVKR